MKNMRNLVVLRGHLGRDPELKEFGEGRKVVNFSLATEESYRNKKGEWINSPCWHRCTAWDKVADRAKNKLKKGSQILITGKIKYEDYEDKEGIKRKSTKIIIEDFTAVA